MLTQPERSRLEAVRRASCLTMTALTLPPRASTQATARSIRPLAAELRGPRERRFRLWRGIPATAEGALAVVQAYVMAAALVALAPSASPGPPQPVPLLQVLTDVVPFAAVVALDAVFFGVGALLARRAGPAAWIVPPLGAAVLLALLIGVSPALFAALRVAP